MIAKKTVSKKKNMVMGVVLIVVLIVTGVFVYIAFFSSPDIDFDTLGANGLTAPGTIKTKINTEVLNDPRVESLNQYGPAEVTVQYRGRKADPFDPF